MTGGWEELSVGQAMPVFVDAPLTRTDFVRYQGASGDMNPIHHDDEFARAAGFPTVLSVGMLSAGIAASRLADWLGPGSIRRFRVRFREQAWPGDILTYTGRVVAEREVKGKGRLVEVEFAVARVSGRVHIEGWATLEIT